MEKSKILAKIRSFIVEEYWINYNGNDIEEIDLFENGFIDSMGLMKLINFFVDEFEIDFDESMLYDERFVNMKGQSEIVFEMMHHD